MTPADPARGLATAPRRRRVRVAYCIDTMDVGGTEMNAVRTAERLDRDRFEVVVISLHSEGPLIERYRRAGIRVVHFALTSLYDVGAVRQGWKMWRFLRREKISVLHCHDLYANLFGAPWGRLARVPLVITSRRWIHPLLNRRLEVANRWAYRVGHRVLANSAAVAASLREVDGVGAGKILTVSNFVDEGAFQAPPPALARAWLSELGIPAGALVVGCVARLAPVKDHATLLRAVASLLPRWPNLHLLLVGDGECRAALEAQAREMDIVGAVHFAGYRPNEPNLHHMFDVSVLSSLSEGFPNSIVEAMAAGRPVVATAVGGNVDAVRPDTGVLVKPADPVDLAAGLARLLADPSLRVAMGEAGRAVARDEYLGEAVVSRLETLYLDLLGSAR